MLSSHHTIANFTKKNGSKGSHQKGCQIYTERVNQLEFIGGLREERVPNFGGQQSVHCEVVPDITRHHGQENKRDTLDDDCDLSRSETSTLRVSVSFPIFQHRTSLGNYYQAITSISLSSSSGSAAADSPFVDVAPNSAEETPDIIVSELIFRV